MAAGEESQLPSKAGEMIYRLYEYILLVVVRIVLSVHIAILYIVYCAVAGALRCFNCWQMFHHLPFVPHERVCVRERETRLTEMR